MVFEDGKAPFFTRFSINSVSLHFTYREWFYSPVQKEARATANALNVRIASEARVRRQLTAKKDADLEPQTVENDN